MSMKEVFIEEKTIKIAANVLDVFVSTFIRYATSKTKLPSGIEFTSEEIHQAFREIRNLKEDLE